MGYTEPPQPAMPMSRAAKRQLRKTHLNGGDVESEWRDSVGPTMLAASYVLDDTMFGRVRVVATQEGAYLDPTEDLHAVIAKTQGNDSLGAQVRKQLEATAASLPGGWTQKVWWVGRVAWREHEGILHFDGKLYVPPEGGARAEVLWSNHDNPLVGHFGYVRMLELIWRKYYWPHMAKEIKAYTKSCTACQWAKPTCHKPYGELQSLQQPWGPYTDISMDFIVGLPPSKCQSKAYNSILVIMDRYTKMACYITVRSDIDTPGLAAVFVQKFVLAGLGIPDSIVSDQGSVFTLTFWSAVCYHLKVCRRLSTAFHPQTDGQTERQNSTLEQYLWAYIAYQQDDWVEWLPLAKFTYNNSWQSTTGELPFYLLMGQNPRFDDNITEIPDHSPEVPAVTDRLRLLLRAREALEWCWEAAVAKQVEFYNKKVKPWSYSKGDLVLLSAAHINTIHPSKKLDWKFHGPFQIAKMVGARAYCLELRERLRFIHDVFHVSLLEPFR